MTHICISSLTIIGSDNGLPPDRRQAIIWTNAGILLIGPLGRNFSEFLIEILIFSFNKMRLKVSSVKRRPFCLGLNVLIGLDRNVTNITTHTIIWKFLTFYLQPNFKQTTWEQHIHISEMIMIHSLMYLYIWDRKFSDIKFICHRVPHMSKTCRY